MKLLNAAEKFKACKPDKLTFIRLEDLVEDSTIVMSDIMAFIGRDFDSTALDNREKNTSAYILPNEAWKLEGATKAVSKDLSAPMESHISQFEKIQSEFLLSKPMRRYGYRFVHWNNDGLGLCEKSSRVSEDIERILNSVDSLMRQKFIANPIKKYVLYKNLVCECLKYVENRAK